MTTPLQRRRTQLRAFTALTACGIPVHLWGPPGTGKTQAVLGWARRRGLRPVTLIGSLMDPTDLGVPARAEDGQSMKLLPPGWLLDICRGDEPHLLFLDELNCSPGSVMAALLRLVNQRAVHEWQMPDSTVIAAAGNDPEHVPQASELPPSMQSRFAHIDWQPLHGSDDLIARADGYPVPEIADPSVQGIERCAERWRTIIAAFVTANPIHSEDLTSNGGRAAAAGRGYPTPRSWDMAAQALGWAEAAELGADAAAEIGRSLVGWAAAAELAAYTDALDLPDPEEWLVEPALARPLDRQDQTIAALGALVAAVIRDFTEERFAAGLRAALSIAEAGDTTTLSYPAISQMIGHGLKSVPRPRLPQQLQNRLTARFGDYLRLDELLHRPAETAPPRAA